MKQKEKSVEVGDYVCLESWKKGDKLYNELDEEDESDCKKRLNPEEEILPIGEYKLKIDYPLQIPYVETLTFTSPIKRKEIVEIIVDRYHKIYNEENSSSSIPEALIPGMYNRVETNGKYGIWGHELGDLCLHTIYVDKNNVITLGVDS